MDEDRLPGTASAGLSIRECRDMIKKSLQLPKVKFLRENLEKSGCKVEDNFIKAINCHNQMAGGYAPRRGIFVCSNEMTCQDDVNQVILHELIHAYDECRAANLDWADCAHHACAEIRANHLSGDCHFKRELLRGNLKIGGQESECIKRRVMKSVTSNPYCSATAAREGMEAVWNVCYNDTQPFDRAL
ncbi:hypothetical protein MLD38_004756 [Melastoma candidum]|uniref:Uncharacterized protein n=1 Tax=Melastoma candidum TaxID=119954 RepID=A0ACB9SAM5_9MYRT|nr:hypothetical protein MLD38_004756 [Melastoma candidum]